MASLKREREETKVRHFVVVQAKDTVTVNGQACHLELHQILDFLQGDILVIDHKGTMIVKVLNFDERSKTDENLKEFMAAFQ